MVKGKKRQYLNGILIGLILSLTVFLLYSLGNHISLMQKGDRSGSTISIVLIECIALFLLPFLNPKYRGGGRGGRHRNQTKMDEDQHEKLKKKIKHRVKLNETYEPSIIKKCSYCRFENPGKREKCLNCGKPLF